MLSPHCPVKTPTVRNTVPLPRLAREEEGRSFSLSLIGRKKRCDTLLSAKLCATIPAHELAD